MTTKRQGTPSYFSGADVDEFLKRVGRQRQRRGTPRQGEPRSMEGIQPMHTTPTESERRLAALEAEQARLLAQVEEMNRDDEAADEVAIMERQVAELRSQVAAMARR